MCLVCVRILVRVARTTVVAHTHPGTGTLVNWCGHRYRWVQYKTSRHKKLNALENIYFQDTPKAYHWKLLNEIHPNPVPLKH